MRGRAVAAAVAMGGVLLKLVVAWWLFAPRGGALQ
jgi:hypothetical protein